MSRATKKGFAGLATSGNAKEEREKGHRLEKKTWDCFRHGEMLVSTHRRTLLMQDWWNTNGISSV